MEAPCRREGPVHTGSSAGSILHVAAWYLIVNELTSQYFALFTMMLTDSEAVKQHNRRAVGPALPVMHTAFAWMLPAVPPKRVRVILIARTGCLLLLYLMCARRAVHCIAVCRVAALAVSLCAGTSLRCRQYMLLLL